MGLIVENYENREAWLMGRTRGIGASSAASAVGCNKWQSNVELWELLTGKRQPKELIGSSSQYIEFGNKAEPIMRELFKLRHPEIRVTYNQYGILYQSDLPWLRATLDGQCETDEPRRYGQNKGILEIKTATLKTKQQWEEWNGRMPQHYYIQCLHQLLATGWDYVILFALLMGLNEWTIREFEIYRDDVEDDLAWLLEEEKKFWGYVERNEEPPEILPDF